MFNKNNNHTSLSSTLKKGSLLAVITTAVLMSIMLSILDFHTFSKESKQLELKYIESKKAAIKQEVLRVTENIERVRNQTRLKVKARIKKRTYEAHAIATNIFNKFNGKLPEQKIKKLIIEALRPLRFFNNESYFFIHSLDGVLQLHGLRPHLEGNNRLNFKDSRGQYIVRDLFKIIKKSKEGFLSYKYPSLKSINKEKSKITFVKHFKPYNWSIGSGDYLENIEKDIQIEILHHIEYTRFGKNSYIFVVDFDGNILMNPSQKHLIGTNMSKLVDPNGVNVFLEERKAVENPEGDFIYYVWNKPSSSSHPPKMTFMKGIQDWRWMIGAGLYIDDAQKIIQQQNKNLKNELLKQNAYMLFIVILISIFIIYISNKFTNRLTGEIGLFLSFFTRVSEKAEKINIDSLRFIELKELAVFANKMLAKKIATEKSLRASEETLRMAQKITHIGSWELDIKNNHLHWSDEMYQIFEIEHDKNMPSYEMFMSFVHPDDKPYVDDSYHQSVKNKTDFDIDHRILLKDGIIKHVREHAKTYYNEEGKAINSSGTIQDITELKEKEDQLRRTQKMDALGKLTGGIAHDYNNMMGVVLGYSELLLSHVAGNKKATEYVAQIRTAGERAKELTKKLMTFSRYKISEEEVININEQLHQLQQLLEKTLTARIKLTLNLEKDIWLCVLDPGDFNDAIINMTINSSHAIGANGTLDISTYNTSLNKMEADALELSEGDYVAVSLADSGYGMNHETVSKIFDPFFSTKGDEGTGLGLSQVYGLVKRSNGTVYVQSQFNIGTTFTLYFPRAHANDESTVTENKYESSTIPNGHETILIVDDEPSLSEMAADVLKKHGYQVLTASSAEQALKVLETEPVHLLFSDIIMPQMNGYELAEIVERKYPSIIIQLASGYSDANKLDIDTTNIHLLAKPYSNAELLTCIRDALDEKQKTINNDN